VTDCLLEDDPGITVVGEASDGDSAVRLALALAPRVILMDYVLPDGNGLAAMKRIHRELPDVAVLMLSMRDEESLVRQALAAGARGYVVKDAVDVNLAEAVRLAASGGIVVTPRLLTARTSGAGSRLTRRELEVLTLICRGLSARAIAAELGLSVSTVRIHRASIIRTLNIHRTTALVAYAARHCLVDVPHHLGRVPSRND
jgi:DNA-binding NarL/FixJ family response regulator